MNIEYILWDFDGTLAYRDGMWTDTLFSVLQRNNIKDIPKEDIRPLLNIGFTWDSPDSPHKDIFQGKSWWEFYEGYFTEIFKLFSIPDTLCKALSNEIKAEYMDKTKWHLFSDVNDTLSQSIATGYKNVIISNHIPELSVIVKNLNIEDYFYKIYSSANIGYEKPNKKIFEYVLHDLKTIHTKCMMIGDSYEADVAGAIRSRIKPILVRKENTKNYKWYSKDLGNILEIIASINRE